MNHSAAPDALLTVAQAAKRLQVGERTLRDCIARGHLPVVRLSARCLRIQPEDLEAYILRMRRRL